MSDNNTLLFSDYLKDNIIIKELIMLRKSFREFIFKNLLRFYIGDILIIFYWIKGLFYRFEGLCICVKYKNMQNVNVSLILRNSLNSIGIEVCISYFFNRLFYLKFSDFKRKQFIYRMAKLYFVRRTFNIISRVI